MKIEDRLFIVQILGAAARLIPVEKLTRKKLLSDTMQMLHNSSPATRQDVEEILDSQISVTFSMEADKLQLIREAINGYYLALDRREHGGVAENKAFQQIQNILGMNWNRGEQLDLVNAAILVASHNTCPKCQSLKVDPCGRGGKRCTECGETFGAD